MDERFEALYCERDEFVKEMEGREVLLDQEMGELFKTVDVRMNALHHEMDKRFECIVNCYVSYESRLPLTQWLTLNGFKSMSVLDGILGTMPMD